MLTRSIGLITLSLLLCFCGRQDTQETGPSNPPVEDETESPIPTENPVAPVAPQEFPSFDVPETHEKMQEYRAQKDKIWNTSFGRLFQTYVTMQAPPAKVVDMSAVLTERIFSDLNVELIRVAALQVLVEDLYEAGSITPEISHRIMVLEGNVNRKQFILDTISSRELLNQAPIFLAFGFLGGSKVFMNQARNFMGGLTRATASSLKTRSVEAFSGLRGSLAPKAILSRKFFDEYSLANGVRTYINTFGPYSFAYVYYYQGKTTARETLGNHRTLMFVLERLSEMGDL